MPFLKSCYESVSKIAVSHIQREGEREKENRSYHMFLNSLIQQQYGTKPSISNSFYHLQQKMGSGSLSLRGNTINVIESWENAEQDLLCA